MTRAERTGITHWSLFILAGLGLVLAHGLKLPGSGSRAISITAFLVGLFVTALAVKSLAAANGIGRTTDFDRFVNAAVIEATQDDAPLVVFTGASYSRNGIDPERLTLALRERGYPHRVINLSIPPPIGPAPYSSRCPPADTGQSPPSAESNPPPAWSKTR
ncbi:MAG: hypothetical protein AAF331_12145, partial [Pseudomonadota bacterium]